MQYLNGLEKFDMHFSKEIILGILLGMVSSAIILIGTFLIAWKPSLDKTQTPDFVIAVALFGYVALLFLLFA